MKERNMPIEKWTDETINLIYGYYLDGLSEAKRKNCEVKYLTINQKREFLISEQKKFDKALK